MVWSFKTGTEILLEHQEELVNNQFKVLLFFLATQFDGDILNQLLRMSGDLDALTGRYALVVAFMPPPSEDYHGPWAVSISAQPVDEKRRCDFIQAMTENSYELARVFGLNYRELPVLLFINPKDFSKVAVVSLRNRAFTDIYSDMRSLFSDWYNSHKSILLRGGQLALLAKSPFAIYRLHKELRPDFERIARDYVLPIVRDSFISLGHEYDIHYQALLHRYNHLCKQPRNITSFQEYLTNNELTIRIDRRDISGHQFEAEYERLITKFANQESINAIKVIPEFSLETIKAIGGQDTIRETDDALASLMAPKDFVSLFSKLEHSRLRDSGFLDDNDPNTEYVQQRTVMSLTGSQFQQLQQALLNAFPSHPALAQMVRFGLNESLDSIAGTGSLADVVFQLITWAEARGKTDDLIAAAYQQNPNNPTLKSYVEGRPLQTANPANANTGQQPISSSASSTGNKGNSGQTVPMELFYSYSHKDEELRETLETHLSPLKRQGVIAGWHDRRISAGTEWADQIDEHLNSAQIILLLISADFLASDYCYDKEMTRAMERHEAGAARVIPIILRPCDWHGAPFGKLQALPKDAKPITDWSNRDAAFLDVAQGIR